VKLNELPGEGALCTCHFLCSDSINAGTAQTGGDASSGSMVKPTFVDSDNIVD